MGKIVAAHAVIILEMPDHRLDGGASLELALRGDATLLAGGVDPEPACFRCTGSPASMGLDQGVISGRMIASETSFCLDLEPPTV